MDMLQDDWLLLYLNVIWINLQIMETDTLRWRHTHCSGCIMQDVICTVPSQPTKFWRMSQSKDMDSLMILWIVAFRHWFGCVWIVTTTIATLLHWGITCWLSNRMRWRTCWRCGSGTTSADSNRERITILHVVYRLHGKGDDGLCMPNRAGI